MIRWRLRFGVVLLGLGSLVACFHADAIAWAEPVNRSEKTLPDRPDDGGLAEVIVPPGDDQTGYLGIVADDRAARGHGVRVLEVIRGAAAERGGLKAGDLIVEVDGRAIRSMVDLAAVMQPSRPGETKTFVVQREGKRTQVRVVLGRRPPPSQRRFPSFGRIEAPPSGGGASPSDRSPVPRRGLLGVRAAPISDAVQRRLRLPIAQGALVAGIVRGSPADEAGVPLDAVIVGVDGQAVAGPDDLARLVNQAGPGAEIELQYFDRGRLVRRRVRLRSPDGSTAVQAGNAPVAGNAPEEVGDPAEAHRLPLPSERTVPQQARPAGPNASSQHLDRRLQRVEQRLERLESLLERLLQQRESDARSPHEEDSDMSEAIEPPTQ